METQRAKENVKEQGSLCSLPLAAKVTGGHKKRQGRWILSASAVNLEKHRATLQLITDVKVLDPKCMLATERERQLKVKREMGRCE